MSDYSPVTVFVTKDSLSVNDPDKKVVGAELDAEFDAIATAIGTKADAALIGAANGLAELNALAKVEPVQLWAALSAPPIATGAVTYDCTASSHFYTELTENITIDPPSTPVDGSIWIILKQDATGSRTVTWDAVFCFAGGSAPTMTATAGKADAYHAVYNATLGKWLVVAYAQNFTVA